MFILEKNTTLSKKKDYKLKNQKYPLRHDYATDLQQNSNEAGMVNKSSNSIFNLFISLNFRKI